MATLLRWSRSFLIMGFDFEGRMECTSDTVSGLKWPGIPIPQCGGGLSGLMIRGR